MSTTKFQGFAVTSSDPAKWSTVEKIEFEPTSLKEKFVEVKIKCCGVCGSDCHTLHGSEMWGGAPLLPAIVGHEIVGEIVDVGKSVTDLKIGDLVGVGAQIGCCFECEMCLNDNETYCPHLIDTYNATYPDGSRTFGGYSSHIRAHEFFVFKIPENLDYEKMAPMLCAGITTYSPLVRNGAGGPEKLRIGIVGLGGLGFYATMFAKALDNEVWVFSRTDKKKEDALKIGADHFVATEKPGWNEDLKYKFDLIICCANSSKNFDIGSYLSTLKVHKKFISVGLPEEPFTLASMNLVPNGSLFGASHLGSRKEMLEMLQLASEKQLEGWVEKVPISKEGVQFVLEGADAGRPRYRYVLTDYDKEFS
ncbi:hypothetical protein CANARDRAFT_30356 [[Candida] arabinofermentans NRRL YB-2248]|uniref:Enoyl reductase (ER) domain-containing protein n=1 Tax=[Candida] arabinofermentans NRRL YB-2248 TaxID=983967 RepID=A0A1E4SU26_9ASCO|nr:hypothetical protein CANARDRAFT_30356 [[Candida] arabinofermentans NRRL YB-2248]